MLDEAFSEVKALIGIQDADELVQKLNQMDELIFSRFNFTPEIEAEIDALEYKIAEAQRELEMLRNCDLTPNYLIASDGITETNVIEYLAAIERKAMKIVEGMKDGEDSEQDSQGSTHRASRTSVVTEAREERPSTACVSLPTTEDTEDDGDRPLTIQELQNHVTSERS
ncbi:hypothetical protein ACHAWO_005127 [Cyclotella atomus]|uniref:ODAD1 central coiled coil region domain-containing protein n=1 Tax=Cyclotella atomus TaxID=382360 RepID=A0ABD3NA02_9STRA